MNDDKRCGCGFGDDWIWIIIIAIVIICFVPGIFGGCGCGNKC